MSYIAYLKLEGIPGECADAAHREDAAKLFRAMLPPPLPPLPTPPDPWGVQFEGGGVRVLDGP